METKTNPLGFILRQIKTEQFAIIEEAFKEGVNINLGSNFSFSIINDQHIISALAMFKFEQNNSPFLLIEVSCNFQIAEDSWNSFQADSGKIIVPKEFASHLMMLTVGTTRGVLHSKTESTRFNHFLLPTINVATIVREDVTFN